MSSTSKRRRGRPPSTDSQQTRRKILLSARQCFAHGGYSDSTNKQIAEAAGVTASALYNHFPAKPQLYYAVLEASEVEVAEALEAVIDPDDPILKQLKDMLAVYADMHSDDPSMAVFMASTNIERMRNPEIRKLLANPPLRTYNMVRRQLEVARKRGEIDTSVEAESLIQTIIALSTGLSLSGIRNTPEEHRQVLATYSKILEGSLFKTTG